MHKGRDKEQFQIILAKEILIEQSEIAELISYCEQLDAENKQHALDNHIAHQAKIRDKDQLIENEREALMGQAKQEEKNRGDL